MHKSWASYEFSSFSARHKSSTTAITYSGSLPNNNSNNSDDDEFDTNINNNLDQQNDNNNNTKNLYAGGRPLPNREITPGLWGACDFPPVNQLGAPADAEEAEATKVLLSQIETLQKSAGAVQSQNQNQNQSASTPHHHNHDTTSSTGTEHIQPSADYLCFFDSDERYRSAEERSSEAILEQAAKSAAEHVGATRHRMTKPVRNLLLPIHPDIPSAFKLRLERDRFVNSAATVMTQEPQTSSGEVMAFDIVKTITDAQMRNAPVTSDSMINVPLLNTLGAMRTFIDNRLKELPRLQLRLLQRYISSSFHDVPLAETKTQTALLRAAKNSFSMIADEMDMLKSAAQRIGTYHDRLVMVQRRKDASHATTEAGTQPEDAMLSPAVPSATADAVAFEHDHSLRVIEDLRADDFKSYLHAKNTDVRMNRKIQRLLAQVEMIPLAKRFEMYTESINASIDGKITGWRPASTTAFLEMLMNGFNAGGLDTNNQDDNESQTSGSNTNSGNNNNGGPSAIAAFSALPTLNLERQGVARQLNELCSCFGLEPHVDGSDTHSFVFGVTRKASIVFQAQQRSMSFLSEKQVQAALASLRSAGAGDGSAGSGISSSAAAASHLNNNAGIDGEGDIGLSKPKLRGSAAGAGSPGALFLDADSSDQPAWLVAQRAAIAAVAPKPHPALDAELKFIAETNFQTVQNRWKERASKGGSIQTAGSITAANKQHHPNHQGDHHHHQHGVPQRLDSTTTQRLFCVFLLRFVRIREIRRRLFAALNFFASIERKIAIDCQTVAGAQGLIQTNLPISGKAPSSAPNLNDVHPNLFGDTNPSFDSTTSFDTLLESAAEASQQTQKWFTNSASAVGSDPTAISPNTTGGVNSRGSVPLGSFNLSPDDPLAPVDTYRQPENLGSSNNNNNNNATTTSGNMADGREFTWSVIDGTSCPMRSSLNAPTPIVYKTAIAALQNTENEAASIASYFIAQRSDAAFQQRTREQEQQQDHQQQDDTNNNLDFGGAGGNQHKNSMSSSSTSAANIDYLATLEDILECEGWFAEAKRDVIASLFTAYSHSTDVNVQSELAKQILETIRRRPRMDLRDTNFVKSYSAEVLSAETEASVLKQVLQHQIKSFREVVSELGLNVAVTNPPLAAANASNKDKENDGRKSSSSNNKEDENQHQTHHPNFSGPKSAAPTRLGMPFYLPWNDAVDGGPLPHYRPVPSSDPSSVFELVSCAGSIHKVLPAAKTALKTVFGRFPDLDKDAAAQLQLEVTMWREMLDAWNVLEEEDRSNRDMLQMRPGGQPTAPPPPTSSINAVAPPPPTHLYWNLYDDPPTFDALMNEIASSSPVFGGGKGGGGKRDKDDDHPGGSHSEFEAGRRKNAADQAKELSPTDVLSTPSPAPLVLTYVAAIEALEVRTKLVAALHRTELLYNCHRRQATMMGITIKRQVLDPIDFEARRAFAEVDRVEQLQNRMDAVGAGAPPTTGNIDDGERVVLSVSLPVELLPRLAIAEFDMAMSRFDFSSETGIRRLLTSQIGDLHRALSIQVASKNLASCVVGMNNAPIDMYLENLARKRWEALAMKVADSTFMTNATGLVASPMEAAEFGLRKLHWPALEQGDDPLEDRTLLQQLYVSLNHVKSSLRRNILQELNTHATADVATVAAEANQHKAAGFLRMPAADLARRRTKILKEVLLEEYCNSSAVLCVRYGAILDSIWHATNLRWYGAQHPDVFTGLLNFGGMYDRVRNVPQLSSSNLAQHDNNTNNQGGKKSGVSFANNNKNSGGGSKSNTPSGDQQQQSSGENNNATDENGGGSATNVVLGGLLSRSGLVDDYRYVPHPVQLLVTDYDPSTSVSQFGHHPMTPPEPRLGGSKQQSRTFIECSILTSLSQILADYHSIVKLGRNHSVMGLSQHEALTVLHFPAPPPENALSGEELRDQRRGAKRYRVRAWNSLETLWRAHLTICQRDASYFVQSALSASTDGYLEPHSLIDFFSNCHKVMHLKFNALSRGTIEELKNLDALAGATGSSSSSSGAMDHHAASSSSFNFGGTGDDGSTSSPNNNNNQNSRGDRLNFGSSSDHAANSASYNKAQAALAAQRSEIMQLQSDILRARTWTARVDSFSDSADFLNRTTLCRQSRSNHPMSLFLQQLRGGIRRVFVPVTTTSSGNDNNNNNGNNKKPGNNNNNTSNSKLANVATARDGTSYQALPPHGWSFSADVAASVLKQVQALVGNTPPPLTEGAAHQHHLLDALHLGLLMTLFCRQRETAGGDHAFEIDVCSAFERFPVYENTPSLVWLACSQRARSIWKREVEKFEAVTSSAGSIIDIFDPNRQKATEGGDAFGYRTDGDATSSIAAHSTAVSAAANRDVTAMSEQSIQSRSKAHSRGSDYAIALRTLTDNIRRDQLRDACMILVREEKMPAHPSGQNNQQLMSQGGNVSTSNNPLHQHGSNNPNTTATQHELQLRHASFQMMHSISTEWTTRMMAKTRKWIERLDLLARETAMAINSGEMLPSFIPSFIVGSTAPLLQRLAEAQAEDQFVNGGSSKSNNNNNSQSNSMMMGQQQQQSSSFSTRDIRSRIVTAIMIGELHRMLIKRSTRDVQSTVALLEASTRLAEEQSAAVAPESTDVKERLQALANHRNIHDPASDAEKQEIFCDFANVLISRSSVVRDEFGPGGSSNPVITYQIPETALSLALSTASRRLGKWCYNKNLFSHNYFSTLLGAQQRRISALESEVSRLESQRELDQKMVTRRVQAAVSDQHFALLFDLDHLSKEVGSLRQQLINNTQTVREAVTAEFEDKLSNLHQQLLLSQGQYRTFQRRLQDQLQNSLEGIKRDAILSVTKMESAPMHMKKQALKLALADDELHNLKRENSVLRQTVLKAKLWFEVRLLRQRSDFEQRIHSLETAMEEARSSFWLNKELNLQEREKLRLDLEDTQVALARAESEVDQLRRDLQTQVGSRRDITTYKAQQAKLVADLQAKIRRLEQQRARMQASQAQQLQQLQQQQQQQQSGVTNKSGLAQHNSSSHPNTNAGSEHHHHHHGDDHDNTNSLPVSPIERRNDSPQSNLAGTTGNANNNTRPRTSSASSPSKQQQQHRGGLPRPPSSEVAASNRQNASTPLGTRRRLGLSSAGGSSQGGASSSSATAAGYNNSNNNSRPQSRSVMHHHHHHDSAEDNQHHHQHHSYAVTTADASHNNNPANQAMIRQVRAQLERERSMKHQAMARAEQLQKERDEARLNNGKSSSNLAVAASSSSAVVSVPGQPESTAALWQRKYVEAAHQIQHLSGELAKLRNQMRQNNQQHTPSSSNHLASTASMGTYAESLVISGSASTMQQQQK